MLNKKCRGVEFFIFYFYILITHMWPQREGYDEPEPSGHPDPEEWKNAYLLPNPVQTLREFIRYILPLVVFMQSTPGRENKDLGERLQLLEHKSTRYLQSKV